MARPLVVAHRAGNDIPRLHAVEAIGVDMVEADLHLFRGQVEVRHAKTLGPLPVLWERWHLVRPFAPRMRFADLLRAAAPETRLMLDLKGPFLGLSRRVLGELGRTGQGRRYAVCARNWMLLRPFAAIPGVQTIRSVGGRWELRLLLRRHRGALDGVSVAERLLDDRVVAQLRERTDFVMTWGVATAGRVAELAAAGVTAFSFDDDELMRAALVAAPPR
jgi:glycerophosphoryl diester phosphodiesterase